MVHLGFSTASLSFLKSPSFGWVIDTPQFLGRQYGLHLLGVLNRMQAVYTEMLESGSIYPKISRDTFNNFPLLRFPSDEIEESLLHFGLQGEGISVYIYGVSYIRELT